MAETAEESALPDIAGRRVPSAGCDTAGFEGNGGGGGAMGGMGLAFAGFDSGIGEREGGTSVSAVVVTVAAGVGGGSAGGIAGAGGDGLGDCPDDFLARHSAALLSNAARFSGSCIGGGVSGIGGLARRCILATLMIRLSRSYWPADDSQKHLWRLRPLSIVS